MELKQQVCSLELAKRLKELGVKQESYFYWLSDHTDGTFLVTDKISAATYAKEWCSAFTVAEFGIPKNERWITYFSKKGGWTLYRDGSDVEFKANTEADARAKMLIYLIENKFYTPNG